MLLLPSCARTCKTPRWSQMRCAHLLGVCKQCSVTIYHCIFVLRTHKLTSGGHAARQWQGTDLGSVLQMTLRLMKHKRQSVVSHLLDSLRQVVVQSTSACRTNA